MNQELHLGLQIRKILDQGCEQLDGRISTRLKEAREEALVHHASVMVSPMGVLSLGSRGANRLLPYLRTGAALGALMIGMMGSYYWNSYQEATDNEEIDSALLSADLPVDAYTDQGFHAWLNHSPQE
jgi:hypothetical protein